MLPVPGFGLCELISVKKVIEYLSLLHVPGIQVSLFLLERTHIFSGLSSISDVLIEIFSVALDVSGQIQSYLGFSFPNFSPGCFHNVYISPGLRGLASKPL